MKVVIPVRAVTNPAARAVAVELMRIVMSPEAAHLAMKERLTGVRTGMNARKAINPVRPCAPESRNFAAIHHRAASHANVNLAITDCAQVNLVSRSPYQDRENLNPLARKVSFFLYCVNSYYSFSLKLK